ncbi:MAG TPA: DUF86 domain-containing protein, partial [Microscillaceae bacterium]|nr:DUF86 domain-containing protein [Microscillaceae bacterium]
MKEDRLGDRVRLEHIQYCLAEIKVYTENANFDVFSQNSMMYNACLRQLEIMGEAANRLSTILREKYPSTNWIQIIGLRNLLIHEYFGVKPEVIWEIIQYDLPFFDSQI